MIEAKAAGELLKEGRSGTVTRHSAVANERSWRWVGGELGISEITVKAHRGSVMRKMKAADLVNMAARLRLAPAAKG